jgi:drug/metabolite transporter (DMT)-like permease
MSWIFIAFLSPIFYGFSKILDNLLANKLSKNLWVVIFFSGVFTAAFTPLVWLIQKPEFPTLTMWPVILVIGAIEVFYLYPYYKSLQLADTSVVVSMFSMGRIFIPILAFILVGEVLKLPLYIGFAIIIMASAAITFNPRTFKLNKAFFYMVVASFLVGLEAVLYKYVFNNVSWSTGFVWVTAVYLGIVLCFLFFRRLRLQIGAQVKDFKKFGLIIGLEELASFAGAVASTYTISLVPVSLIKGLESSTPFFVLIYAVLLKPFFPNSFREEVDRKNIIKKISFFIILIFGVYLVIG